MRVHVSFGSLLFWLFVFLSVHFLSFVSIFIRPVDGRGRMWSFCLVNLTKHLLANNWIRPPSSARSVVLFWNRTNAEPQSWGSLLIDTGPEDRRCTFETSRDVADPNPSGDRRTRLTDLSTGSDQRGIVFRGKEISKTLNSLVRFTRQMAILQMARFQVLRHYSITYYKRIKFFGKNHCFTEKVIFFLTDKIKNNF